MYYGQSIQGVLVTGNLAANVLSASGIGPDDVLSDSGETIGYNGTIFKILQREMYFPPDNTSPDGWHLVYAPSQQEIDAANAAFNPPSPLDSLLNWLKNLGSGIQTTLLYGAIIVGGLFLISKNSEKK